MDLLTIPNTQPREKADYREDGSLDLIKIFYTIQGEGPYAGCPSVFVRLAGCNLDCALCDTNYTQGRFKADVDKIAGAIGALATRNCRLVVMTGGEPFRQNVAPLVQRMLKSGWFFQFETNGTMCPSNLPEHPHISIVCSPKAPSLNTRIVQRSNLALKYVLDAENIDAKDGLPTSVLGNGIRPARPPGDILPRQVYVQPCDHPDHATYQRNVQATVKSSMEFGYRLSVQIHKYVGLD